MSRRICAIALGCIGLAAAGTEARTRGPTDLGNNTQHYLADTGLDQRNTVGSAGATEERGVFGYVDPIAVRVSASRTRGGDDGAAFAPGVALGDAGFVTFSAAQPANARRAAMSARAGDRHGQGDMRLFADAAPGRLPEPASWALMLIGFGAIGALTRRSLRRSDERFTERMREIAAGESD